MPKNNSINLSTFGSHMLKSIASFRILCYNKRITNNLLFSQKEMVFLNTSQLEYFIFVHRLGSINKAAEKIHVSPQTISSSIKSLECELGYPLFIRNGKKNMTLSEYGEIFIQTTEDILLKIEKSTKKMQGLSSEKQQKIETLNIFASPAVNNSILPTAFQLFSQQYPYIKFTTTHEEAPAIFSILPRQNSLAVFVSFDELSDSDEVLYKQLFIDKVYAIFLPQHPLAKQKTISISSILRYPLAILQSTSTANPLCTVLEKHGTPNYYTITANPNIYEKAIANNQVVGFINKSALKTRNALSAIIDEAITMPIKNMPPIYIYMGVGVQYYAEHQKSIDEFLNICRFLL